jgi:glycosyltransferase involved in cell wall biosynthesis
MNATCDVQTDQRQGAARGLPRVLFLARSLQQGGAERQLVALASGLHRRGWPVTVVCFYGGGVFQGDLESAGVPLVDLRKRGRWDVVGFTWRLLRVLRKADADIVHGYLPVANMLALLARLVHPRARVIWGVRSSYIDRRKRDWLARLTFRLSCRLAWFADAIIANSEAGEAYHTSVGYPGRRISVIPNGIDTERFQFDPAGRKRLRESWGIDDGSLLVGLVGRVDPMKDHTTFLQTAALLAARDVRWRFVCVGGGKPHLVQMAKSRAEQLGLDGRLVWAGPQDDMAAVYSALDIAVSTSYGEGFSNVIGEAMACGRSCVVTEVGDSAAIVGESGLAVPAKNPDALCEAIIRMHQRLLEDEGAITSIARARIVERFGTHKLIERTEAALHAMCRTESGERGPAS